MWSNAQWVSREASDGGRVCRGGLRPFGPKPPCARGYRTPAWSGRPIVREMGPPSRSSRAMTISTRLGSASVRGQAVCHAGSDLRAPRPK